jgi:hypothetical protein
VSSHVPEPGANGGFKNFTSSKTYTADDDVPLDDFEKDYFFRCAITWLSLVYTNTQPIGRFVFKQMFRGRYTYAKGQGTSVAML